MKVKDFIALYEEHKPHTEKLPDITSKKIKSFLKTFNRLLNEHQDKSGKGHYLKFLYDMENLYESLSYAEKKDITLLNKDDLNDIEKYRKFVKDYIKEDDAFVYHIEADHTMKGLKNYLKDKK